MDTQLLIHLGRAESAESSCWLGAARSARDNASPKADEWTHMEGALDLPSAWLAEALAMPADTHQLPGVRAQSGGASSFGRSGIIAHGVFE